MVDAPIRTYACVRTYRWYIELMRVTATHLRANIYAILDQILTTGESVDIERNGRLLRIEPVRASSGLDRLATNPSLIVGDPDDLVELDWSHEWSELRPSASTHTSSPGSPAGKRKKSVRKRER